MASFYSVLGLMYVNTTESCEEERFDIISSLPLEIASYILRLLPAKDLLSSVYVCRNWMSICKSDTKLRKTLRQHLRRMRKTRFASIIRDEYGRRSVAGRLANRVFMKNINNSETTIGLQYGFYNFARVDRNQMRFAPYLKESSGRQSRLQNANANQRGSRRLRF